MAVVHTAMFDAMNAVQPRYRAFRFDGTAPQGANADAAAAAHTALVKLFRAARASTNRWPALGAIPPELRATAARPWASPWPRALVRVVEDRVGVPTQ
jgi:hypothetical protein